jgi:hypothetical protein
MLKQFPTHMVVVTTSNFVFGSRARALLPTYWPPPSTLVGTAALVDKAMSSPAVELPPPQPLQPAQATLAFARQSQTSPLLLQT